MQNLDRFDPDYFQPAEKYSMAIRSEATGHPGLVNGVPRIPYLKEVDVQPIVKPFPRNSSKHLATGSPASGHLDKKLNPENT